MLFYKENGVWKEVSKVFIKENGKWVEVSHIGVKDGEWNLENFGVKYIPNTQHRIKTFVGNNANDVKLIFNKEGDGRNKEVTYSIVNSDKINETYTKETLFYFSDTLVNTIIYGNDNTISFQAYDTNKIINSGDSGGVSFTIYDTKVRDIEKLVEKLPHNSIITLVRCSFNTLISLNIPKNIKLNIIQCVVELNISSYSNVYNKLTVNIKDSDVKAYTSGTLNLTNLYEVTITNCTIRNPLRVVTPHIFSIKDSNIIVPSTSTPYISVSTGSNVTEINSHKVYKISMSNIRMLGTFNGTSHIRVEGNTSNMGLISLEQQINKSTIKYSTGIYLGSDFRGSNVNIYIYEQSFNNIKGVNM